MFGSDLKFGCNFTGTEGVVYNYLAQQMLRFISVLVQSWRILHHAIITALTMTKIMNFSMEDEKDTMLAGKYI